MSYTYSNIEKDMLARELISEIEFQCEPLFELWYESNFILNYRPTFNTIRILFPIIEQGALLEFDKKNKHEILEKLEIPLPKIAWEIFRDGLMHSIRPFTYSEGDTKYTWGIGQYKEGVHRIVNNNICIYPYKLMVDLKQYLEKFRYNTDWVEIQTGIERKY